MAEKPKLKSYSDFMDEPLELGPPNGTFDELLELGHMMATSRPGLIVYMENPPLQKWGEEDAKAH
jgi:hypothetical protein